MNRILAFSITLSIIGILTQRLFGQSSMIYQTGYLIMGLIAYFVITKIDKTYLLRFARIASVIGVIALVVLLIVADETRGSRRWFFVFGFGLQPSVLFLPFYALSLGLTMMEESPAKVSSFIKYLIYILVPVFLIFKQPDLGTSIIIFVTLSSLFLTAGARIKYIVTLALAFSPAFFLLPKILKPYQIERLVSFLNPHHDPSGINYNSLQAVIAIGSGGLFGKGFLQATQSKLYFLPESHTDFVFAAFTETFGFIGAVCLIAIYFFLFAQILKEQETLKKHILFHWYSIVFFTYLLVQFIFNIGMNLRLLPVVGIPLPFISYGGSSLLTLFMLLGIREKLKELEG